MLNIVLYHPEIPANTGNIMRTCQATRSRLHIIGPLPFSLDEKSLRRAGMDYIKESDYHYYSSYGEFQSENDQVEIYYITRYSNQVYTRVDFSHGEKDYWIMFGRESTGIDHDILRHHLDHTLRIPMVPDARSLNLSNCVALITYEVLRQQNFLDLATSECLKGEDFLIKEK
ncbi:MAG TPA: tRNA (cytidine(34)-2'-O)-methyltransferase [Bacilli bacterium]|nr:tRNA (cytidine(34)-2'-O)-methyltransferase [Bacilli bacterium]